MLKGLYGLLENINMGLEEYLARTSIIFYEFSCSPIIIIWFSKVILL
jgi:hypothetical protein